MSTAPPQKSTTHVLLYIIIYTYLGALEQGHVWLHFSTVPKVAWLPLVLSGIITFFLSTVKTQNAKRAFRNARSERGGGCSSFWFQKPPNFFFAPCKRDPLCHIEFFNNFSKPSWTSVNSTRIKFVRGQNLFLSEKKGSGTET